MAAAVRWSGFTEDDLRRIREENELESEGGSSATAVSPQGKQAALGLSSSKKATSKKHGVVSSAPRKVLVNDAGVSVLEPSAMLSPPKVVVRNETCEAKQVKLTMVEPGPASLLLDSTEKSKSLKASNGLIKLRVKSDGHFVEVVPNDMHSKLHNDVGKQDTKESRSVVILQNDTSVPAVRNSNGKDATVDEIDMETVCNKKKLSLEDFQKRQKMIEEQNKRRRAMLSKAISDRKKKTQAETEKLTHIQKELQKLDSLVSNDVAILRDQIEIASLEFNDVQKRYERAEREFVEAKIELFKKMERKEHLTEHLCTIIEENELRKAKKLAQLMNELELESLIDECHEQELVLPQLCALNDITYSYCTTLRDPKSSPVSPTEAEPDSVFASVVIAAEMNSLKTDDGPPDTATHVDGSKYEISSAVAPVSPDNDSEKSEPAVGEK